jgi:hypothetical protein
MSSSLEVKLRIKTFTFTFFVVLWMRSEGNDPRNEPTVGYTFTTMLQYTGRFWAWIY